MLSLQPSSVKSSSNGASSNTSDNDGSNSYTKGKC
jgi:hypothetical protein